MVWGTIEASKCPKPGEAVAFLTQDVLSYMNSGINHICSLSIVMN
jgi:hypothetical protein